MKTAERNRVFTTIWPELLQTVTRIWFTYRTTQRIGTLDDVKGEAALAVLTALENFTPASSYPTPDKERNHLISYCNQVIHNALIHKSRTNSLVHVPGYIAADVFNDKNDDARPAINCKQLGYMPLVMSESPRGDAEYSTEELHVALRRLTPYERTVIGMAWGLDGSACSIRQIAEKYALTNNAARRRVKAIETKLRLIMQKD